MRKSRAAALVLVAVVLAGCGGAETPTGEPGRRTPPASPSASPIPTDRPPVAAMPCDPGMGFPKSRQGCPDPTPSIGWVTAYDADGVHVQPLRTLHNDAEGRAYASERGLEYPFPNDYLDVPDGDAVSVAVPAGTVCTGAILVRTGHPASDRVTTCARFARTVERLRASGGPGITSALWFDGDRLVQLSELYRP